MSSFIFLRGKEIEINRWKSVVMHKAYKPRGWTRAGPIAGNTIQVSLTGGQGLSHPCHLPASALEAKCRHCNVASMCFNQTDKTPAPPQTFEVPHVGPMLCVYERLSNSVPESTRQTGHQV